MTTVGYGDVYPKTVLGKILGAFIAMMGIGLFALPAGIIASGFASELQNKTKVIKKCPHCGKEIDLGCWDDNRNIGLFNPLTVRATPGGLVLQFM